MTASLDHSREKVMLKWAAGIAATVYRLATGRTVWCSKPCRDQVLPTCPDWTQGPPSLLYNGYRVSCNGKKRPKEWCWPLTLISRRSHEWV